MQSLYGFSLLLAVVLAVRAIRLDASGRAPRFMSFPAVEEAIALILTVATAFGVLIAGDGLTSLY